MQTIGEALKNAREQKGISLEQAEEDTKIRKRYLQALEDGEYSIIPGAVYVKGFLRNYAGYLQLNQEEIMIEYKLLSSPVRETGPRTDIQEAINKRRVSSRANRRTYIITVVVAVIALLTYAFYSLIFDGTRNSPGSSDGKKSLQTEKPAETKPADTGNPQQSDNNPNTGNNQSNNNSIINSGANTSTNEQQVKFPVAGNQVTVQLKGKDEASWVRVTADGRVVFTGELKPGEIKQFMGNTVVKLRLGNAGGVEVDVNGQELGTLGNSGEVVDKEYIKE